MDLTVQQLQVLVNLDDYDPDKFRNLTRQQVKDYIDANITDLASAKTYLKKLSLVVLYLYKKIMDEI